MKGLKFASLAIASLMALSLVGCGPQEDPKVRFLRECKQSLSPDECQQLAYNKSQEEQARIMKGGTYNQYANQPGGYNSSGYVTPSQPQYQQFNGQPQYQQPQYGQPGYVQPNNGFADTATGAVVGLAAGAAIGHAIGSSNNNRNVNVDNNTYAQQQRIRAQEQQQEKDRLYQQQVRDANAYRANPVPAYTDTNKVTRFAAPSTPSSAPSAPAAPVRQSVFNKPAAAPAPTYSAPKPAAAPAKASYTPRPSVFSKK